MSDITYDENYKGIEGVNYPADGTAFYQQDFMKEQADIGGEIIDRESDYFTFGVIEGFEISLSTIPGYIDISPGIARDFIGRRIISAEILSEEVPDLQESILSVRHVWEFVSYILDGTNDTKFQRRHSVEFNFTDSGNVPGDAIKLYKIQRSGSSITIVEDLRDWEKLKVIKTSATPTAADHLTTKKYVDGLNTALENKFLKMGSSQTLSCTPATLQATINSLPKILTYNVTINVSAGTITDTITLNYFTGEGIISINGNTGVLFNTHTVAKFTIIYCTNTSIYLNGFNLSATAGNGVYIYHSSAKVDLQWLKITEGNKTTPNFFGVFSVDSTNIKIVNCEISNKFNAVYSQGTSNCVAYYISGSDNNVCYKTGNGGELNVVNYSGVGTLPAITGDMLFQEDPGSLINFSTAITLSCTPANLQKTINGLLKHLRANVTINVSTGIISDTITLSYFEGRGILTIKGDEELSITRTVVQFTIGNCTNTRVVIIGFNLSATSGNCVYVYQTSSNVFLQLIKATAGNKTTGSFFGIVSTHSSNVYLTNCEISNKYYAIYSLNNSSLNTQYITGTNNYVCYVAYDGGKLSIGNNSGIPSLSLPAITGDKRTYADAGGIIIDHGGGNLNPVNSYYIQFPDSSGNFGTASVPNPNSEVPANLFGGTWSQVTTTALAGNIKIWRRTA
ncbi:MAG: hypothetical protein FWH53_00045 [Leptospirales bacterium]|nr:hypothetical protein [Leptospirales bacterium]